MVNLEIVCLSLTIAAVLILAGILFRIIDRNTKTEDSKSDWALFFPIAGSVILVILGIVMLGDPLVFPSGTNITMNDTHIETVVTYAPQNFYVTLVLSSIIMLLGFLGIILCIFMLTQLKYKLDLDEPADLDIYKK